MPTMGPFQEHSVIDGSIFGPTGCRLKLGSRITPVKARPAFISVETGETLFGVLSQRASNSRPTRSTVLAAFSLLATCRLPGTHRQPTPVPGSGSSPRTPDPRIFGLGGGRSRAISSSRRLSTTSITQPTRPARKRAASDSSAPHNPVTVKWLACPSGPILKEIRI